MAMGRLACDELAKGAGETPNMATSSPGAWPEQAGPRKEFGSNELLGLCGGNVGIWGDAEQGLLKADNAHGLVVDHADDAHVAVCSSAIVNAGEVAPNCASHF